MRRLAIADLARHCYRDLSGGQQQRVLLARALCAADRILILDEPVTGLDPGAARELYETLKSLNQEEEMAILMVSHDLDNAFAYGKKILHLSSSDYFFGTMEEYRNSPYRQVFSEGGQAHGTHA